MFLGTHRGWWIAAGLLFVAALALISTDIGGTLGNVVGVLLLFASMGIFAMSPKRSGKNAISPAEEGTVPPVPAAATAAPVAPPRPRPTIDAGDASEV